MNAPLYTIDILRWKVMLPPLNRLRDPDGTADRRSPICGSTISVDINLEGGRVGEIGLAINACSFGEAAASVFAAHAIGRTSEQLRIVSDQLANWLEDDGPLPDWPNIEILEPAKLNRSKRPAVRLPFEAAADAARQAGEQS